MREKKGKLSVFYHFYKPDDVVSAVHFSDLCEGLADRNWDVNVYSTNRYCRYPDKKIASKKEIINGVLVNRIWRPKFRQSSNFWRLVNSIWVQLTWILKVLREKKPDYFVVGSDPQFSQFMFPFLKLTSPKSKVVYWCFDLYPEAIFVEYNNRFLSSLSKISSFLMRWAYKRVDLMVDIGSCMRKLLLKHKSSANCYSLVPWALFEPRKKLSENVELKQKIFGPDVKLVLIYSGNLGAAHDFKNILDLARAILYKDKAIKFAFSVRGNRVDELKTSIEDKDENIVFLPFANQNELEDRLSIGDIHIVSLKEQWQGIVVPSKFFGAISIGRPVIFNGPLRSSVAEIIQDKSLGYVLNKDNIDEIANEVIELANDKNKLDLLKNKSFTAYQENYSKKIIIDRWDEMLLENLA